MRPRKRKERPHCDPGTAAFRLNLPIFAFISVVIFLASGSFALADGKASSKSFRYGVDKRSIGDVDPKDAKVTLGMWVGEFAASQGYNLEIEIFSGPEALIEAFKAGRVDLGFSSTLTYFKVKEHTIVAPYFGTKVGGRYMQKYLLLVSGKSAITALGGLKGKRFEMKADEDVARLFLSVSLGKKGLALPDDFFEELVVRSKHSLAVMSVFFGKADGCLVPESVLETMALLNPQVRKALTVLLESPPLLDKLTFIRPSIPADLKRQLLDDIMNAKTKPRGRQILMMLKVDDLAPLSEADLKSTYQLISYKRSGKMTGTEQAP